MSFNLQATFACLFRTRLLWLRNLDVGFLSAACSLKAKLAIWPKPIEVSACRDGNLDGNLLVWNETILVFFVKHIYLRLFKSHSCRREELAHLYAGATHCRGSVPTFTFFKLSTLTPQLLEDRCKWKLRLALKHFFPPARRCKTFHSGLFKIHFSARPHAKNNLLAPQEWKQRPEREPHLWLCNTPTIHHVTLLPRPQVQ